MQETTGTLEHRVQTHIEYIYQDVDAIQDYDVLAHKIIQAAQIETQQKQQLTPTELWSQEDIAVITYGDTLLRKGHANVS